MSNGRGRVMLNNCEHCTPRAAPTSAETRLLLRPNCGSPYESINQTAVIALLFILSSCAQQELTRSQCIVGHGSGFVGTTGNQEQITVAENGSPCGIGVVGQHRGWGQFGLGGQIERPPAHGTASIRDTAYATQISYTPAPNFVGDDSFAVSLGPDSNVTVIVKVVPVANASAASR